jgi:hypothetical protein
MKQHFFSLASMFFSEPVDTGDEGKEGGRFEHLAKRESGGAALQWRGRSSDDVAVGWRRTMTFGFPGTRRMMVRVMSSASLGEGAAPPAGTIHQRRAHLPGESKRARDGRSPLSRSSEPRRRRTIARRRRSAGAPSRTPKRTPRRVEGADGNSSAGGDGRERAAGIEPA